MKKTLSIILSVLLILFFVGCTKPTQTSQAPQEALNPQEVAQQTVFAVNAFLSYKGDLNGYLEFGGDVSAVSSVDVLPDTSGKISRIYVSVGDVVTYQNGNDFYYQENGKWKIKQKKRPN